jgi:stearoyl-CoA desaturase (delta-9 desaturase)
LGFAVWLLAGWSGLVVGFLWSTVALWHATFSINSLAHLLGRQRYVTADDSRNNWWLALLTFGEGWHNNHHHYQSAARQGFRWYEIDVTYYVLKALAALRLVHGLQSPPRAVVRSEQRLRRAVVEKAAGQLAGSFQADRIASELRAQFASMIGEWSHQFDETWDTARRDLDELLREIHLPAMPTMADLRARAAAMFAGTPSMNDIVERGRQILIDGVLDELVGRNAVPVRA